MIQYIENIDI